MRRGWGGSWGSEGGLGAADLEGGGARRCGTPGGAVPALGSVLAWRKEEGSSREIAGPTCQVHVITQSACHVGGQTRSKGFWTSSDTLN